MCNDYVLEMQTTTNEPPTNTTHMTITTTTKMITTTTEMITTTTAKAANVTCISKSVLQVDGMEIVYPGNDGNVTCQSTKWCKMETVSNPEYPYIC